MLIYELIWLLASSTTQSTTTSTTTPTTTLSSESSSTPEVSAQGCSVVLFVIIVLRRLDDWLQLQLQLAFSRYASCLAYWNIF